MKYVFTLGGTIELYGGTRCTLRVPASSSLLFSPKTLSATIEKALLVVKKCNHRIEQKHWYFIN